MRRSAVFFLVLMVGIASPAVAPAVTVNWNPSNPLLVGLNAQATFTSIDATHLDILLTNTSTGVPPILGCTSPPMTNNPNCTSANQILTGLGFDLPGTLTIAGGSAVIGAGSMSQNFSSGALGAGADISVEWGFANGVTFTSQLFPALGPGDVTLANYFSTISAQTTVFQAIDGTHPNLDGPNPLNGPQAGIIANPPILDLGGLGAVKDSVLFHLTLSGGTLPNLDSFDDSTVRFEFGSSLIWGRPRGGPDHPIPEPTSLLLLGSGLIGVALWRRSRKV